jgi:hypothetical protein
MRRAMRTRHMVRLWMVAALAFLAGAACRGKERNRDTAKDTAAVERHGESPETTAQAAANPRADSTAMPSQEQPFVLTAADLDAYERGVRREITIVEGAKAKVRSSRSGTDTLSALGTAIPQETQQKGAEAAGISVDRYRQVVDAVDAILAAADLDAPMTKMMADAAKDTANVPPEMRAQLRENIATQRQQLEQQRATRYKSVPPDVLPTFQRRAPGLDSLRAQLLRARLGVAQ